MQAWPPAGEPTGAADRPTARASGSGLMGVGMGTTVYAIGRTAIVLTFIVSGILRLMDIDGTAGMLPFKMGTLPGPLAVRVAPIEALVGLSFAQILVIAGAVLEIVAGLLVAIGIFTRWAAAINIYYFHDFWNLGGAELMTAFNKLSIMGALLILAAVAGPRAPTPEIPERSA